MLNAFSSLKGYTLEAKDGRLGTVDDLLFDDTNWKTRWIVVDTGGWLNWRKVLIHPAAVVSADHEARRIDVALTKAQIEGSPEIGRDRPVSQQMQSDIYAYYGWSPLWDGGMFGAGMYGGMMGIASPLSAPAFFGSGAVVERERDAASESNDRGLDHHDKGDPHLCSVAEVTGYHVHATDGDIGHVQDVLVDGTAWGVRYFVLDTSNWWIGQHVLVSPDSVTGVDWSERHIRLDIARERVKSSPTWHRDQMMDDRYEQQMHATIGQQK